MYSFDGNYKRLPMQNFGGSSQNYDRDALIRKAHEERQKRAEIRKKTTNANIIQSWIQSFLTRQKCKEQQRNLFDDYVKNVGLTNDKDLEFLLKRILFFYYDKSTSDGNRLVFISKFIIENSDLLINNAIIDRLWLYRTKKLLYFCILQMRFQPLIEPLQLFEMLTSLDLINQKQIKNTLITESFLEGIYIYLLKRKYFKIIHEISYAVHKKAITIDLTKTIYQMTIRTLKLIDIFHVESKTLIMSSFVHDILLNKFSQSIYEYLITNLASDNDFPFNYFISYLKNNIVNTNDDYDYYYLNDDDEKRNITLNHFLFYSFLKFDEVHLNKINNCKELCEYINILAILLTNINNLTHLTKEKVKKAMKQSTSTMAVERMMFKQNVTVNKKSSREANNCILLNHSDNDDDDDDEDDDIDDDDIDGDDGDDGDEVDDDNQSKTDGNIDDTYSECDMDIDDEDINDLTVADESKLKQNELIHRILKMLKDTRRSRMIIKHIDDLLDKNDILHSICKICHYSMLFHVKSAFVHDLLYLLAMKPKFIRKLWSMFTSNIKGLIIPKQDGDRIIPILATFCILFGHLISTLTDSEFCQDDLLPGAVSENMPFTLTELIALSSVIKNISLGLVELAFPDTRSNINVCRNAIKKKMNKIMWPHILKVCVLLLRQLYSRDLRCAFCPEKHWPVQTLNLSLDKPSELHFQRRNLRGLTPFQPIKDFTKEDFENSGPPLSTKQIRSITILKEIPFVVAFSKRVGILQGLLQADKLRSQGDLQGFLQGPSVQINVRRSHLYEDAFFKLREETNFRSRFRIQMINDSGLEEAGIDGGGIFREFLTELIKAAFDPNRGFFLITTDNKLYPNPSVGRIVQKYQQHYFFIGRILGKALYENLLVELPLADFFLSKLAGKHSDVDIHQLASLDPMLHRNLMSIKTMTNAEIIKLGLDFTITTNELGETKIKELKPNGANINVNSKNCIEYIRLMADYKLNTQIRQQCAYFRRGLANLIKIEWLHMFSNKEFQVLISGAEVPVDIEDLKLNTHYASDYSPEHPTIIIFWNVVNNFNDLERKQLLKFVTSCSRPPLLGFKDLDPPFCIQNAGDIDRLPTSSTCMNLLKLPAFTSAEQLREKLIYAIQSGSGFELS